MAVQGIEALDVLQARITKMLDILADLREKRDSLQGRVETLEQEGAAKDDELGHLPFLLESGELFKEPVGPLLIGVVQVIAVELLVKMPLQ